MGFHIVPCQVWRDPCPCKAAQGVRVGPPRNCTLPELATSFQDSGCRTLDLALHSFRLCSLGSRYVTGDSWISQSKKVLKSLAINRTTRALQLCDYDPFPLRGLRRCIFKVVPCQLIPLLGRIRIAKKQACFEHPGAGRLPPGRAVMTRCGVEQ